MDYESICFMKRQPASPRTPSTQSSPRINGRTGTVKTVSPILVGGSKPASPKPGSPVITMSPRFIQKSLQKTIEEMRQHIAKLKSELESEKVSALIIHVQLCIQAVLQNINIKKYISFSLIFCLLCTLYM